MQGGTEKMSDEETEGQLDKVVKLLAYISDKDLFSEFYRKKLARRLLNDFSASDELERSILSRLKQQCGAQFTSKVKLFPKKAFPPAGSGNVIWQWQYGSLDLPLWKLCTANRHRSNFSCWQADRISKYQ